MGRAATFTLGLRRRLGRQNCRSEGVGEALAAWLRIVRDTCLERSVLEVTLIKVPSEVVPFWYGRLDTTALFRKTACCLRRTARKTSAQYRLDLAAELSPRLARLSRVLVRQVVPPHLAAGQHVVLASIDNFWRHAERLHHRCCRASQVVRCPFAASAAAQHERVVMTAALQLHAVLELLLAISDLLGDRLEIKVQFAIARESTKASSRSGHEGP